MVVNFAHFLQELGVENIPSEDIPDPLQVNNFFI